MGAQLAQRPAPVGRKASESSDGFAPRRPPVVPMPTFMIDAHGSEGVSASAGPEFRARPIFPPARPTAEPSVVPGRGRSSEGDHAPANGSRWPAVRHVPTDHRRPVGHAVPRRRSVMPLPVPFPVRDGDHSPAMNALVAELGDGTALPGRSRGPLEAALGVPVDDVRIHQRPGDRITADLLHSQAFTYGNHVVLGSSATSPAQRDWLVAHEVAHVVQQRPRPHFEGAGRPRAAATAESEADLFADAVTTGGRPAEGLPMLLTPTDVGLARRVIWKSIVDLPDDHILIIDIDDGDFVGGCVRAIVPHAGVKLIKKRPHAQLFNIHVGFITNAKGEFCIFFYESVTRICTMKCFASKEDLRRAWGEVTQWLAELIKDVLIALAIAALVVAAAYLAYLIAAAIVAAIIASGLLLV